MTEIVESGMIDERGNLLLPMDRVNAFLRANAGTRAIVTFRAVHPGTTAAQRAYYFSYVIPTIRRALLATGERKTERETDEWLRRECASVFDASETGDPRSVRDLSAEEMADYLEWLKQFAAENLSVYIEDPKAI